jgi:hypothetical protein
MASSRGWAERYQVAKPDEKTIGVRFNTNPDFSGTTYSYHREQDLYAAFTVAELGEMLPNYVFTARLAHKSRWSGTKWSNGDTLSGKDIGWHYADAEADARAKMLIYLLEKKLMA